MRPFRAWTIGVLLLVLTIVLGYFVQQADFYPLISGYSCFFVIYWWVCQQKDWTTRTIHFFIGWGILLRLVLVFSMPNLSDDIYRFIWDGRLINQGLNPFEHLPTYYIENHTFEGLTPDLFAALNSPEYFTIYPPIAQVVFACSTWICPSSVWGSTVLMKVFLFCCELGSIALLYRLFAKRLQTILWYVLNPLILLEIMGNVHFEGAMIFFLLGAYYLLKQYSQGERTRFFYASALFFAASIASKLLTLLFLPFLVRAMGWKRSFLYFAIVGLVLLLLFFPLLNGVFIHHFGESLDLYFRRFEFNGSLYYVLRWIGFQMTGYNMIAYIGPFLAGIAGVGILLIAFLKKNSCSTLPQQWLWAICLYLLCTTTVHPWYTALPIVLCLFTPYRFPIIWSGLIFLTYINYSYAEYYANLWVVGLEYLLVLGYFAYEFTLKRSPKSVSLD